MRAMNSAIESEPTPSLPPTTHPVMTRAAARELGVPVRTLRGSGFIKLFFDAYVASSTQPSLPVRARVALALVAAGAHLSHHTAVELWGGTAPPTSRVHLTFAERSARCQRDGIAAHFSPIPAWVARRRGLPVSSPTQAFLDLASAGVELVDLVIAGDSLVKSTGTPPEAFVAAADEWLGNRARLARKAARLIRRGVDSPMETRLRLLLVLAGFPEPLVNFILRDQDGEWLARFDLCYPEWKLIIEFDGRQHAFDTAQWATDIERRETLDRLGWRLIVIRSEDIYANPEQALRRVQSALHECGAGDVPNRFRIEWSRHFPGRRR